MLDIPGKSSFVRIFIVLLLLLLVIVEMVWSYRNNKKAYNTKDTLANLGIFIGFHLSKLISFSFHYGLLVFLSKYSLFTFKTSMLAFFVTFLSVDFVYYWYHRLSHNFKPLWIFHLIHHSSLFMNLTVSYRLNWLSFLITPFVMAPLVLLGLPVDYILVSFALNLFYQFFLHTEAIGHLGFIESILNTPSAHRVHHGSNDIYIDKNFGGVFIIWDRLFGTYQKETLKPTYGTTKGFISNNPFILNFKGFIDYFKGEFNYKG